MPTILDRLDPLRSLVFRGDAAEAMRFYHSVLGGSLEITMAETVLGDNCAEKGLVFTSELALDAWSLDASDAMTAEIAALPDDDRFIILPTSNQQRWTSLVNGLHGGATPVQVTRLVDDARVELVAEVVDRFKKKWMILLLKPPPASSTH